MSWHAFDNESSLGQRGSEDGIIVQDEVYDDGARITLERDGVTAPFAITCGISGWMVHTRFFDTESEAQIEFASMKMELSKIVGVIRQFADSEPSVVAEALSEFVARFP